MFIPVAIQAVADSLATRMCYSAQASVTPVFHLNPMIYRRIRCGDAFDIGLTNPPFVTLLAANGFIDDASHRSFGAVPLALGRRKGDAVRPVAHDGAGVAAILSEAKTIVYVGAGTSGQKYLEVLNRLQLGPSVGPKSFAMKRGTLIPALLAGKADLITAPLTTLLAHPCLEPAAVLPHALGTHIELSVFVKANPPFAALALLEFLLSADLDREIASAGIFRLEAPGALPGKRDAS